MASINAALAKVKHGYQLLLDADLINQFARKLKHSWRSRLLGPADTVQLVLLQANKTCQVDLSCPPPSGTKISVPPERYERLRTAHTASGRHGPALTRNDSAGLCKHLCSGIRTPLIRNLRAIRRNP